MNWIRIHPIHRDKQQLFGPSFFQYSVGFGTLTPPGNMKLTVAGDMSSSGHLYLENNNAVKIQEIEKAYQLFPILYL